MKFKTITYIFLLLIVTINYSCSSSQPGKTPSTVEEAEIQLAKKQKKSNREAKKSKKAAYKRYWKGQSKSAKKSIKKNHRRNKRIAKHKKKKK